MRVNNIYIYIYIYIARGSVMPDVFHSRSTAAAVDMSAGGTWLHMQDGPRIPHSHLAVAGSASSGTPPSQAKASPFSADATHDTR